MLVEGKLEEPEVVPGFGWLEEVHTEPGMLLQWPGVGFLLLFDASEEIARQRAHLAAHVEQLELGLGLGQKFGQGIDGRHEGIRLNVMRAIIRRLHQIARGSGAGHESDGGMAATPGAVYSNAPFWHACLKKAASLPLAAGWTSRRGRGRDESIFAGRRSAG
ncbi:hypothetical protein D3C79_805330 [compost metagenome]